MNIIRVIVCFTFMALLCGCSARTAYDSLRYNRELECSKLQGAEQTECMKRTGMSYDEYQWELNKRSGDK